MPNRFHPARFVVLSRSNKWKYGMGESEFSIGLPPGMVASTFSTVHGSDIFGVTTMEGSSIKLLRIRNQGTGVLLVGVQT